MAVDQAGIMALPENQGMQAPQLSLSDSYDAMQQGLMQGRPDAYMDLQDTLAEIRPELEELTDEQIGLLLQALQDLYDDPQNYAAKVQELVKNRFIESAEELPPEYDEEFIATLMMVLVDIQRTRQGLKAPMPQPDSGMPAGMPAGMTPPPQQFARGGIADAARMLASQGRNGDTMLAHITPEEARLLKSLGGSGTINPQTGLPEFWPLLSRKRGIGKAITKALSSPLGRIVGTIALGMVLGPAVGAVMSGFSGAAVAATTSALSSGLVTAAAGGDLKASLTAAATGFITAGGGPVSNYVGKYTGQFISNPAVLQAANATLLGTGVGMATGQNFKDALKSGLIEGAIAGGTAYLSGAPKVEADQAAKTAAADATVNNPKLQPLEPDSQAALEDFYGTNKSNIGAGAQKAYPNYVPTTDANGTPGYYDRFNASKFIPANSPEAQALGLGTPRYAEVEPSGNIFAQKPGMTKSAYANQQMDTAKAGIFGPRSAAVDMEYSSANLPPDASPSFMDKAGKLYDEYVTPGVNKAKGLYDEYLSPSGIQKAGIPEAKKAYADAYKSAMELPGMTPEGAGKLAMKAYDDAMPGTIATYGPMAAAGIGTLALAGGFSPGEPPDNPLKDKLYGTPGLDLINANPNQYLIQGLPGVSYNAQGNITGSQAYQSPYTMQNVRVPTMYADGGIAALMQGGYPRRVGQISGPGTEKSDSIPAMLSDGEFVMTAKAVRGAGGGSRREGAKRMYALMHQLERNAARG